MIPKKIHYCWFGRSPRPKLLYRCLKSWKKYCPDYEIIEWNEDNYPIDKSSIYVQQAYKEKMWAFVSDYVRLDVISKYGGVYFDTDVELIRGIDDLLAYESFFCTEKNDGKEISTGLGFGAVPRNEYVLLMLNDYNTKSFYLENSKTVNLSTCPQLNTQAIKNIMGIATISGGPVNIRGNLFLPRDYFCPLTFSTMLPIYKTGNTRGIHWYSASWHSELLKKMRKKNFRRSLIQRWTMRIIGIYKYEKIKHALKHFLFGRTLM